ncbi:MAG: EamA family transporter [Acidimicrobiia bacterium]
MLFSSSGASRAIIGFPGTGISFAAWRVFIGALGLLLYVASRHGTAGIGKLMRQPLMWAMGLATLLYQAAFFTGVETVGIAAGTLIALGLAPLLAGLIAWAMGLGRPAWQWAACTGTAICGLALLTGTAGHADAAGLSLLALAAACYSFFTVVGVKMVRELAVSGAEVVAASFGIGAVIALPILATTSAWINGPGPILAILYAGLGATTVAYLLFANGISHLAAGTVSTLTLFEPVAATVVGVYLLGETMDARGWLGCLVIIAALGLLGYVESRSKAGHGSG